MTTQSPPVRPPTVRRRRSSLRLVGWWRHGRILVGLVLLAVASTAAIIGFSEDVPRSVLVVPVVIGSLVLNPRTLPWFVVLLLALLVSTVVFSPDSIDARAIWSIAVMFVVGLFVLLMSFRRTRLGVAGIQGESMFVDLRDRILNQGGIPALPPGWHAESALTSAGGTLFAGDFVVASRPTRDRLDLVVVDVSGKGEQAGTRALLLSGAFGGLLGALPPDQFLPAANDYLLRQDWDEGFATAVHLSLDLTTGCYEVRSAGHPPAVLRSAGSGRWSVLTSEGPVLGLMPDAEFIPHRGVLERGDAVMLYTDGMVEEPRRDIDLGIDRLLGEAESLLRGEFRDAAQRLVDALGSKDDDRAMVVVNRL
ncbi:MAG TPA: PP2C family protein-serine/threonine phosphatase [Nocardioides sp.]|uniref:PP2C family protein-serine/threonine phosphatase n=1 Tax=Nocardioides sp. TaxID=35761 RepID=UPI002ED9743C